MDFNFIFILALIVFIIIVVRSFKTKPAEKLTDNPELEKLCTDKSFLSIVSAVLDTATKMDSKWIIGLRLGHPFYIVINDWCITLNDGYYSDPSQEYIINFLQAGKNKQTENQIKAYLTFIKEALNTVPWIEAKKDYYHHSSNNAKNNIVSGSSIKVSVKKDMQVPESFANSQPIEFDILAIADSILYKFSHNHPSSVSENNDMKTVMEIKNLYVKKMEELESPEDYSSFKYGEYFNVVSRCVYYEKGFAALDIGNLINYAQSTDTHIYNCLSEGSEVREQLIALDEVSNAHMKLEHLLYNSSEKLIELDKERIKTYETFMYTEFNKSDISEDRLKKIVAVLTACELLSKKFCTYRHHLLTDAVDNLDKEEQNV